MQISTNSIVHLLNEGHLCSKKILKFKKFTFLIKWRFQFWYIEHTMLWVVLWLFVHVIYRELHHWCDSELCNWEKINVCWFHLSIFVKSLTWNSLWILYISFRIQALWDIQSFISIHNFQKRLYRVSQQFHLFIVVK